ncbi:MAG: LysM peptidoglycan-binding domain-containing protein [Ruminococcus sp.]|nr:LysM peptidoglycan-binding domain-containing protein [Ruminococcus sp.]
MEEDMETAIYTVRKGNTLFGIANFFGTTVEKILRYNNIQDPNMIYVGQKLTIPVDTEEKSGFVYVTRPGDTLWSIAQRFGTTVDELAKKNGMCNPNMLYPGTRLLI